MSAPWPWMMLGRWRPGSKSRLYGYRRDVSFLLPCPTLTNWSPTSGEIAAAAPDLPFYYYHIPSMTNVKFTGLAFLKAATGKIPNLAGIKFTHEDLMDFAECQAFEDGRFDILFGRDEVLLSALATGAKGAVGSNYNFAGPIYNKVIAAYNAGDIETARKYQQQARQIVIAGIKQGGQPAFKSIMKMIGVDCGPVRLPLRNLTAAQYDTLQQELEALGYFRLCRRPPKLNKSAFKEDCDAQDSAGPPGTVKRALCQPR